MDNLSSKILGGLAEGWRAGSAGGVRFSAANRSAGTAVPQQKKLALARMGRAMASLLEEAANETCSNCVVDLESRDEQRVCNGLSLNSGALLASRPYISLVVHCLSDLVFAQVFTRSHHHS
jgi:hypothetical protein